MSHTDIESMKNKENLANKIESSKEEETANEVSTVNVIRFLAEIVLKGDFSNERYTEYNKMLGFLKQEDSVAFRLLSQNIFKTLLQFVNNEELLLEDNQKQQRIINNLNDQINKLTLEIKLLQNKMEYTKNRPESYFNEIDDIRAKEYAIFKELENISRYPDKVLNWSISLQRNISELFTKLQCLKAHLSPIYPNETQNVGDIKRSRYLSTQLNIVSIAIKPFDIDTKTSVDTSNIDIKK